MKKANGIRLALSVFAGLALGALSVQAQTNFWWTNNANGVWNTGLNWTNETVSGLAPNNGGSNDYGITFQNTSAIITTNNSATPRFNLNQLVFAAGAQVVTIYAGAGTNLTFTNSTGGVLPQFIQNSANNVTNNIAFVLATNTSFLGTGAGLVLLNSNVSGTGGLLMGGNYTLLLNASNTYGGATTVTNGTLKAGAVGTFTNYWAFGTNRTITVAGAGTLDINNVNLQTNYNVVISGAGVGGNGAIVNNSGGGITGGFTNLTLAGDATIGGSQRWDVRSFAGLGLVDLGGYTLTKKGANTTSFVNDLVTGGSIIVAAGMLSFEGTTIATGTVGSITINPGSTFYLYSTVSNNITRPIVANGGTLQLGAGAGSANSPILLQSNVNLNVSGNYILNGNITESGGSFAVNKIGGYAVTLNGLNTFSGGLAISGGVVSVSMSENLGSYTGRISIANNSLLQVAGNVIHGFGAHPLVNANGFYGGVDVVSPYNAFVISSNLTGSGKLTKAGAGFLVLLGTNTYTGGTTVSNGTLRIAGGDNTLAPGSAFTNSGGGTLSLAGSTQTLSNSVSIQGGEVQNGTLISVNSNYDARAGVIAANLQGGVSLIKTTTGTLTLLGSNTYSGGTMLTTGTLAIAQDANIGALTFGGGMLQLLGNGVDLSAHGINWNAIPYGSGFDLANTGLVYVVPGAIGGSSVLAKAGPGTLVLATDNNYSGPTIITGGYLQVGNGGTSGTLGTGNVTNNGGGGALVFNRTDTLLVTNTIVGSGGLYVKNGTVVFSNNAVSLGSPNNATYVGNAAGDVATMIVAGNASLAGSASTGAGGLLVGNNGDGILVIKDNANVAQRLGVGGAAGSAGAVYQLGGVLTTLGGAGYDAGVGGYYNGGTYGAYGYYGLYNGISTNANYYQVGGYGVGVVYNLGGSLVQNGVQFEIARNGTGVVYFAGNSTFNSSQNIQVGSTSGSSLGMAILTITDNASVNGGQLQMGVSSQRSATLNLNGGVLQVSQITKANAATFGLVNIDGGTLRATASGNFINTGANAPNGVYIYGGGATLDSSNFNINIAQNLLAPNGSGVSGFTLGSPLAGYIGAPYVAITGGGGTGATAMAQFDYTSGTVTGIVITSHGYGYTTTPNVVLIGGGQTNYYAGLASIAANTSGALTKLGNGALQLTGTNTYGGGSVINGGMLAFAAPNAMGSGLVTINNGGALAMTGAYANATAWLTSGLITTNSTGAIALGLADAGTALDFTSVAGGVYSNLYVGAAQNMIYSGALTFYNNDYRLGGGSAVLGLTNGLSGNTLTISAAGLASSVAINGTVVFGGGITVNNYGSLSLNTATASALTLNGGTLQVRGTTLNSLPALNPAMGDGTTFDINNPGNVFTITTNLVVAGALNSVGPGTLVLGGSNAIAGAVNIAAGALRLTNGDAFDGAGSNVTVASGAALQLQGGITTEAGDLLVLNGTGVANDGALRNMSGNNTWNGPIGLNSASRINADANLLTIPGAITNGNNLLTFGGAGNILLSGYIQGGTANLIKDGSGTLTLTGTNKFNGATFVNGGTLAVDFSAAGAPVTNILYNGMPPTNNLNMGNGTFQMISSGSQVNTQSFNALVLSTTSGTLAGNATVIATNTGTGASILIFTNNFTRNAGDGVVNIVPPGGSGSIRVPAAGVTIASNMSSYLTVNGSDWGTLAANNSIVAFTAYTNVPMGGQIVSNVTSTAGNVRVVGSTAGTVSMAAAGITTLQNLSVTNTGATLLNIGDGNTLRLSGISGTAGGLLLAPGSGGVTIGTNINSGSLTAGYYTNNVGADLIIFQNSANDLTINSAIVNNGTGASTLTIAGTGAGAVNLNGKNSFTGGFYVNSGAVTLGNTNSLTGAVAVRGGTLTLAASSSNTLGSTVVVNGSARLNVNGLTTISANNLQIGNTAGDRASAVINTNLTAWQIQTGYGNATAAGALFLNSGTVLLTRTGDNDDSFSVGSSGAGAYGYFNMTGGVLTNVGRFEVGENGGNGVMDMSGGIVASPTTYVLWGRGNQGAGTNAGIVNISGGIFYGSASHELRLNNDAATTAKASLGIINMSGTGTLWAAAPGNTNYWLDLMFAAGNVGIVNLNGGTTVVNQIKATAAGLSVLNFNGGYLLANPGTILSNAFLTGLAAANIYAGGAIIDTTNNNIIIPQSLSGVSGFGLTSIALATNGAGYIGAPVVLITGGSGTGATAIAQMNLASGQVTNILITSAGSGYLPTDALTLQLIGGGYTTAAVVGTLGFAANINNGGLTKNGSGTLTLTGTNTYSGLTTINSGTLAFAPTSGAVSVIGGLAGVGALQHSGSGMTVLNGDSSGFTGSATISTGVLQFATVAAIPTAVSGGMLVNGSGAVAFDFGGGNVQGALTNLSTLSTGAVALTPNSAGESINFNTTGLSGMYLGAVGTQPYDLAHHTPAVANTWRLGGGGGTLVITNGISAGDALNIGGGSGAVQAGGSYSLSTLTMNSGATFNLAGNNQTINALAGTGGTILNTNALVILTVGSAASTTFGGSITGAVGLTKVGAGTLAFTGSAQGLTGLIAINEGGLTLNPQAGLNENYTNATIAWAASLPLTGTYTTNVRWGTSYLAGGGSVPVWGSTNWPLNTTIASQGYILNNSGSNVTWTFAVGNDDDVRVTIDGIPVVTKNSTGTATANWVLTPGVHVLDVRLSNGGGSGGANNGTYGIFSNTTLGAVAYDPLGRNLVGAANYVSLADSGNGSFLASSPLAATNIISIAGGAKLDFYGPLTIAGLTDPAATPGVGGLVTNTSPYVAALYLNAPAGSNFVFTGNIMDGGIPSNGINVVVNGPGIQTLAGTNTYANGTVINSGGILQINNTNAIPQTGWVTISSNGALAAGSSVALNDLLRLGRITNSSSGSVVLLANSSEAVNFTLSGGYSNLYLGAVGNVNFSGSVTSPDGVTRLGGGGGTLTNASVLVNGSVAIGGGAGTVVLANSGNTYTGTVLNAGTLQFGADAALGNVVAGATNILINGGTLQAGADGLALGAGRLIALASNATGIVDDNGYNLTINGSILGANSTLVKVGAGTVVLAGASNNVGMAVNRGTLVLNGKANLGNSALNVANVAGTTGQFQIVTGSFTNTTTNYVAASGVAGAVGVINQSGGQYYATGLTYLSGNGQGYGAYLLSGGAAYFGAEMGMFNATGGNELFMQSGGIATATTWFSAARGAGLGLLDFSGGTFTRTAGAANFLYAGNVANGTGVITVRDSGFLDLEDNQGINVQASAAGGATAIGVLNVLNGGTIQLKGRIGVIAGATGLNYLNLNGGTLRALNGNVSNTTFLQGLTAAYIYTNGVTIDTMANVITINQDLLAPTDFGVSNIAAAGAGYLAPPLVTITGGSGAGATALAQLDAGGNLTNILMTSAGSGYLPGDVLSATLTGGGGLGSVTSIALGANSSAGGLTKLGTGVLTLGGNNTYNGPTIISDGGLQIGNGGTSGSLANPNVVFSNTASWLGFNHSDQITNSLNVQAPNGNIAALVQNGSGMLVLTNTAPVYNSTVISNGTVYFATTAAIPSLTPNSILLAKGGGVVVGGAYSAVNDWLFTGLITNSVTGGTLALMSGGNNENISFGSYSNLYLGAAPGQVATFSGSLTPANGTTNYLIGGGGGTLQIANPNTFTDLNSLTNRGLIVGVGGPLTVVQILGPQDYSGGTLISNALLSVSDDNNLGNGNLTLYGRATLQITNAPNFATLKTLTINTGAADVTNDISGGSTGTFYNAISMSGANNLVKWGTGTMIINNAGLTAASGSGRFAVEQGTVIVDTNAVINQPSSYHIIGWNSGSSGTELLRANGTVTLGGQRLILGDSTGSTGTLTLQDQAFMYTTNDMYIGNNGTGTVNLNGGVLTVQSNITFGVGTASMGTLNLNANGKLVVLGTAMGKGSSTNNVALNFNGGTLLALNNLAINNGFKVATVGGTSYLDTSNNTVTLGQAFTGAGTLVKLGSGTMVVTGPSNTFASIISSNGMTQFAGTNGMTANRTLVIGAGGAAGYTNNGILDQNFLLRVASNSLGTVALTVSNNTAGLDFRGAALTNVSLGAFGGTFTNSGTLTNFGNTYRLGGGGGTLVITGNINPGAGTNLVAFGNGGVGTLILTGVNTWSASTNFGGLVRYGSTNSMGTNVWVTTGGAIANNGALDTSLFARLNTASDGAFALVANNAAGAINLSAFPNLSLGAAAGSWTNDGVITPYGTTYLLGGGGGTLVITNSTLLAGAGTNLVAFGGANYGTLVLTGTNTYDGGTYIGALGTAVVATVSLGSGAVTNNGTLVFSQTTAGTFSNAISGNGLLIVTNSGNVTLTANNAFTGNTVLGGAGTLFLSNTTGYALMSSNIYWAGLVINSRLSMSANYQLAPYATLNWTNSGGSQYFDLAGTTQLVAGAINLYNGNTSALQNNLAGTTGLLIFSNAAGSVYIYNNTMRDQAGQLAFIKDGAGTQILCSGGGGSINFTGPTTVKNGILMLSNTSAFASGVTINGGQLLLATPGATTFAATAPTLTNNVSDGLGFANGNAFTIPGLAGSGGLTLWSQTGGGVALTVGGNNASTVYSGVLSDAGPGNYYQGSLIKIGTGLLWLSGANTYSGVTFVNGGQLRADPGAGLPMDTELVLNGGVWETAAGQITNTLGSGAGQILIAGGASGFSAYNNPLTVSLNGGSQLVWSNTPFFSPATLVLNDVTATTNLTFQNSLDLNGATRTLAVNSSNTGAAVTMSGVISNSGTNLAGLTKSGNGVLLLTNVNTYNGLTTVSGGMLQADFGVGMNGATNVTLTGGTLSSAGGNITSALGTGAGQVNISGGASGFSAYNTPLTVTLGNVGDKLYWGGASFNPSALVLNDYAANSSLTLQNGLNFNGTTRTITVNANSATITGDILNTGAAAGLTKTGVGTLMLTGSNIAYNGTTTINGGTLTIAGPNLNQLAAVTVAGGAAGTTLNINGRTMLGVNNLVVGNATGSRAVVVITTNLTAAQIQAGVTDAANAAGVVYQYGGTVISPNIALGVGSTDYGYYRLTNGVIIQNVNNITLGTKGYGIFEMTSGTVLPYISGSTYIGKGGGAGAIGELNIFGGTYNTVFFNSNYITMGGTAGQSYGLLNVSGSGVLNAANGDNGKGLGMMFADNNTNVINLLAGGTIIANKIFAEKTTGLSIFNFNGGTLATPGSSTAGASFMTGLTAAYVYQGGAIIDTTNISLTIGQALLAPTGNGVTNITLAGNGGGYIGTPIVLITGGGGTGATAIAQVDLNSGTVTNILITSSGSGYTDVPAVALYGGGYTSAATIGIISTNVVVGGGLTKQGSGTLILNGANTYTGGTVINNGVLQFSSPGAVAGSGQNITVSFGGTAAAGYAMDTSFLNRIALVSSGTVALTVNNANAFDFSVTGQNFSNLSLGAVGGPVTNSGAFTPFNSTYLLGGGGGTLVITNDLQSGTTLNTFASGSGGTLILTGSNGFSTINLGPGALLIGSTNALGSAVTPIIVPFGASFGPSYAMDTNFLALISNVSSGTVALGASTANDLDFSPTGLNLTNVSLGAANGAWTNSGVITPALNTYRLGGGGGTLVLTNVNALTDGGNPNAVNFFGSGSGGRVILTTNNNFTGGVSVNYAGGTVEFRTQYGLGVSNNITVNAGTVYANVGATAFVVGTNVNNQQLVVTGPTSVWSNSNALVVGGGSGKFNSVILSNGASMFSQTAPSYIGSTAGANSNTVTVSSGASWNLGGQYLYIGNGSIGNMLVVNGGTVGNFRANVGNGAAATGNMLVVTNGGTVWLSQDTYAGNAGTNNTILFSDPGTLLDGNGHLIAAGGAGGVSNTVVFANGAVANVHSLHTGFGSGANYNTTMITNGAQVWVLSQLCYIGGNNGTANANANSNTLLITDAGSVLDLSAKTIISGGGTNSTGNRLVVANGGRITSGGAVVIGGVYTNYVYSGLGTYGNQMLITNGGKVFSTGSGLIGYGAGGSSNAVQVSGTDSLWNMGNGVLRLGYINTSNSTPTYALNNTVTVDGGTVASANGIYVGDAEGNNGVSAFNQMIVTNGGQVYSYGTSYIGNQTTAGAMANSNSVTVGSGSLWNLGAGAFYVGNGAATGNVFTINGGVVTNVGAVSYVGAGAAAANNSLVITNGGQLFSVEVKIGTTTAAQTSYGNSVTVAGGGSSTSIWNAGGAQLLIGQANGGTSYGESLYIGAGGIVTNIGTTGGNAFNVGFAQTGPSYSNQLTVTDGGQLWIKGTDGLYIGRGFTAGASSYASNNTALVANSGLLNVAGPIYVGGGAAGTFLFNNSLMISNGATVNSTSNSFIGQLANANYNSITILSNSASWNLGGQTLTIGGNAAATGNVLNVLGGGILTNASTVMLGGVGAQFNLAGDAYVSSVNLSPNDAQLNFNGGTLHATANGNLLSGVGTNYLNGSGGTFDSGAFTVTNPVVNTGSGSLTKTGSGTLTMLSNNNTYSGATTNLGGGVIQWNINNALPQTTTLYADDLSTFNLGAFNQQVAGLDGSHGTISAAAGGALTVNIGTSQTFYGKLIGPGNLTLTGGGSMNLLGTNSFSGNTIVSNATYYVNGLHNGGLITVLSNGLVGGSAPITALYVDNGGTYAPGNSIATQTVGSLTLTNAGQLALELGNNANDQVIVTSSLTIVGGQLKLNLAAYSFIPNAKITLVDWTTASGFAPNNPAQWFTLSDAGGPNDGMVWSNGVMLGVSGGLAGSTNFFTINYDDLANGVASTHGITLTAVPEPGTASLLGLVGVAFLIRRLRQRKPRG